MLNTELPPGIIFEVGAQRSVMKALLCWTEHINHPARGGSEIKSQKGGEKTHFRLKMFSEQAGILHGRQRMRRKDAF